jgi:hypothetical protein
MSSLVRVLSINTGNVATLTGLSEDSRVTSSGNVTTSRGISTQLALTSSGSVATHYSLYIANPTKSSTGNLVTNYALYLESQSTGNTANWGIYSAGGSNYFGGNILVGTTSPTANFTVNGTSSLGPIGNVTITGGSNGQVLTTNGSGTLSWSTPVVGVTSVTNGTSNLVVANNGNVSLSASGSSNVLVISSASANITGTANISGNLISSGHITGGVLSVTGNANVGNIGAAAGVFTGAISGSTTVNITGNANVGNIGATRAVFTNISGTLETASQTNITSVGTLGSLTISGNALVGNLVITGNITDTGPLVLITAASGNISLAPNGATTLVATTTGANVTGTFNTTGNANVGNLGTAGNVTASYFFGNGSQLTGISVAAGSSLVNGTSNVVVAGSGNVTTSAAGTANVLMVNSGGIGVSANAFLATSSGSVGVGTSSPTHKLDVRASTARIFNGTASADTTLHIGNSDELLPGQGMFLTFHGSAGTPYASINSLSQGAGWRNLVLLPNGGNVGIGTTSPGGKLEVVGGRAFFNAASEVFAVGARYVATGGTVYFGATNGTATPDAQISAAGGGALMTLLNGGNVGIGTASPGTKLEVFGSITARAATTQDSVIVAGRAGGTGGHGVTLTPATLTASRTVTLADGNTTLATGTMAVTGGTLAQFAATTSAQLAGVVSDETGTGALVFATSPTLVTPLLGTPTSGTLSSCTGLPISTGVSGLGTSVATFLATPSSANLAAAVTDETGTGALVFATSPTIATPTVTTSAVIPIVNGGTAVSSTLTLQSTSGAGSSDAIIFKTASQSERMRILTTGEVGIGTASPAYLLEIRKDSAGAIGPTFFLQNQGGGASSGTMVAFGGTGTQQQHAAIYTKDGGIDFTSSLIFQTKATGSGGALADRMTIVASGSVGIGTTSPVSKLHVSVAANDGITVSDTTNSLKGVVYNTGGTSLSIGTTTNHPVGFYSNNSLRMTLDTAGNVGIGTASPGYKLDVAGTLNATGAATLSSNLGVLGRVTAGSTTTGPENFNSYGSYAGYAIQSTGAGTDGGRWRLTAHDANRSFMIMSLNDALSAAAVAIEIQRNPGTHTTKCLLLNQDGGLVGIGTTSPVYQLEVYGANQTTAAITNSGNKGGSIMLFDSGAAGGNGGSVLFSASNSSGNFAFAAIKGLLTNGTGPVGDLAFSTRNSTGDTALTQRMVIAAAGNVGIGEVNPAYKLDVNGTLRVTGAATFSSITATETIKGSGASYRVVLPVGTNYYAV